MLDMVGQSFGRLTVVKIAFRDPKRREYHWECTCNCGVTVVVRGSALRSGQTRSCGCLLREASSARASVRNTTHNASRSREYTSWRAMKRRCSLETDPAYARYGGRGITYSPSWDSFEQFLADMGPRPHGTSLDRIDNDGNYEPGNCRWSTPVQQSNNRRKAVRRNASH